MNTPQKLTEAIAHAEQELASLRETAGTLDILRYKQQAISAGIHLQTHTREQLQAVADDIIKAIEARDLLPLKQSAIASLNKELEDSLADRRRMDSNETAARFDQLKTEYALKSQDLLDMFRLMHGLHCTYLGQTGRPLLHDTDYLLMLPTTMKPYDSAAHSTGSIVRAAGQRT